MELFGGWIYEGLSTETKPTLESGAKNGQVFKELDTGESYHLRFGVWEYINLGLAFVKATKSGNITTDASGDAVVTFNTPFIDTNYSIALTCSDVGSGMGVIAYKGDRTTTGFSVKTRKAVNGQNAANIEVSYLCTRDYDP